MVRRLARQGVDDAAGTTPARREAPTAAAAGVPRDTNLTAVDLSPALGLQWSGEGRLEGRRTVVCCTHVVPHAPRAGNEYRVLRLLRWLRLQGYDTVLVLSPLPGGTVSQVALRSLASEFRQVIACGRDGRVEFAMERGADVARLLAGTSTARWSRGLARVDDECTSAECLELDRTFCHEPLAAVVAHVERAIAPCIVLAEYVFMTRALPLLGARSLKVVDTHDVFSSRQEKVGRFGVVDLQLPADEERRRLLRSDLVLAIQDGERAALQALVPERAVITTGVDFDVSDPGVPDGRRVLLIGSDNPMNVKGLTDFLAFAWPAIKREAPDAEFLVAGRLCEAVPDVPEGVRLLGHVDRAADAYGIARVAVNPCMAGTGVKIKTLEALSYLRPVVTWPAGVEGLGPELASSCCVVADWNEFARTVIDLLLGTRPFRFDEAREASIRSLLSAEHVYRDFAHALARWAPVRESAPGADGRRSGSRS